MFSSAVQRAKTVRKVYTTLLDLSVDDAINYRVATESLFPDDAETRAVIKYIFDEVERYNRSGRQIPMIHVHGQIEKICNTAENCNRLTELYS